MTEPLITYDAKGDAVSFVGREAVDLYRAATLMGALGLLEKGIQPTRGFTMRKALDMVESQYTRKHYKRTQVAQAKADLHVWIATMKAAIPSETRA